MTIANKWGFNSFLIIYTANKPQKQWSLKEELMII